MSRLLFVFVVLFVCLFMCNRAQSQSCKAPQCGYSTFLVSNPDQNYVNNFNNAGNKTITCFDGSSSINRITNNMSLGGINTMIFKENAARYEVITPVNMHNKMKIYVQSGANVTINQLSMNGGDTIFVAGELYVNSVQNVNNSASGNRAVIMMQPGASVMIAGTVYSTGSVFQSSGNGSNQISILSGCLVGGILPVKFISVNVKHYVR